MPFHVSLDTFYVAFLKSNLVSESTTELWILIQLYRTWDFMAGLVTEPFWTFLGLGTLIYEMESLFPRAVVTNLHQLGSLKKQKSILFQFSGGQKL